MMNDFFLTTLTTSINRYLSLDPESEKKLTALEGKVITIELSPFHYIFQCEITDKRIIMHSGETLPHETRLKGTPLQLLGAALTKENRHRFFAEDLMLEGNAELGQQLITLFDEVEIDWEEHLSQFIGDAPAFHASQLIRKLSAWCTSTQTTLAKDINDYLHEEANWLPTREALNDFFVEIDALRMDIDRADAKIQQLLNHILKDEANQ